MESQGKLTNLVISYSPDILNTSKKFKQIAYDLKEQNSVLGNSETELLKPRQLFS